MLNGVHADDLFEMMTERLSHQEAVVFPGFACLLQLHSGGWLEHTGADECVFVGSQLVVVDEEVVPAITPRAISDRQHERVQLLLNV